MSFNFSDLPFLASLNAAVSIFTSLYESFQAFTSVQVSHYVDWCSGSVLSTSWTLSGDGSASAAMLDEIDGGFQISEPTVSNEAWIGFNNIEHYDEDGSIFIGVIRRNSALTQILSGCLGNDTFSSGRYAMYLDDSATTFKALTTRDGGSPTTTDSDVGIDTAFTGVKIENTASDCDLFIDGVLKVTNTTTLPSIPLCPAVYLFNRTSGTALVGVRYVEMYNTSITILSSLSERLSALTQVFRQRVVATLSGAVLNERWTFTDITGTGSSAMDDVIDGGAVITTGATDDDESSINFNDIRQYEADDAVCILVASAIANSRFRAGFSEDADMSNSFALVDMDADNTNYELATDDGTTESSTASDIAIDANFHVHKIENGSANIFLTIDGVLKVTKSTNRPDNRQQPLFAVKARSAGAKTGNIRYLEMYNKLTTETAFPSVYEMFNDLTTISKQHYWTWFDGDSIETAWSQTNNTGTGVFSVVDEIDEGVEIQTGASTSDHSVLVFNSIRPFDPTACTVIGVARRVDGGMFTDMGLDNDPTVGDSTEHVVCRNDTDNTNFALRSSDGTVSATEGSVPVDTSFHAISIVCGGSDLQLSIDGVLDVTKSTNRPTAKQQPHLGSFARAVGGKSSRFRYVEVINT